MHETWMVAALILCLQIEEQLPSPPVPRAPISQTSANLASNPDSKLKPLSNLEILTRYIFFLFNSAWNSQQISNSCIYKEGKLICFSTGGKKNSVCGVTELGILLPKVEGMRPQWIKTFCSLFSSTWIQTCHFLHMLLRESWPQNSLRQAHRTGQSWITRWEGCSVRICADGCRGGFNPKGCVQQLLFHYYINSMA